MKKVSGINLESNKCDKWVNFIIVGDCAGFNGTL
ncbi:hypothetical protein JOJ88_003698 [Pantoea cypripedii]|nr:hypothetical protein [Pantoea cypripedii]